MKIFCNIFLKKFHWLYWLYSIEQMLSFFIQVCNLLSNYYIFTRVSIQKYQTSYIRFLLKNI